MGIALCLTVPVTGPIAMVGCGFSFAGLLGSIFF